MALAVLERNALLEQVWAHLDARDYIAIIELLAALPLEEHLHEPELGVALSSAWFQVGELDRSLVLIRRLTAPCERRGNTSLNRRRLNCEGLILVSRGDLDAAESLLNEVLDRADRARDMRHKAWAYNNLGMVHTSRGSWEFALSHFRRAIVAGQTIGDLRHISLCHMNMGETYRRLGQVKNARAHMELAADLSRDTASPTELAYIDHNRAFIHLDEGDLALAKATAARAYHRFESLNSSRGLTMSTELQGRLLMKEGRIAEARAAFQKSYSLAVDLTFPILEASSLEQIGLICKLEGDLAEFIRYGHLAVEIYSRIGSRAEAGRLRETLLEVGQENDSERKP